MRHGFYKLSVDLGSGRVGAAPALGADGAWGLAAVYGEAASPMALANRARV